MSSYENSYYKGYGEQTFKWQFWAHFIRKHTKKNDAILEIGCTYGYLFKYLKDYNNKVGIDISDWAIKQAKTIVPEANFSVMNAEALSFNDNHFKCILCIDTIEHVENPAQALKESYRVLAPGGLMLIATPNPESVSARHKGLKWFAFQDPTHISIKKKKEWVQLLENEGFRIEKTATIDLFDFPYWNKLFQGLNLLSYKIKHPFIKKGGDNVVIIARKSSSFD